MTVAQALLILKVQPKTKEEMELFKKALMMGGALKPPQTPIPAPESE